MTSKVSIWFKKHLVAVSLYSTLTVLLWSASNINWGGQNWVDILEADAKGYYAYLPATFIYHDLNFTFFDQIDKGTYYRKELLYDYRKDINGHLINKYFCGTAIAEMPFFVMAHLYTLASDDPSDGYSKPYLIFIHIGALFYLWLAFYFIIRILRFFNIREAIIAFLIPVFIFGTNIFLYTAMDPGMSHVYSLAFISIFVYFGLKFFKNPQGSFMLLLFSLIGLIILIRPSNGLIVLALPFIAGNKERLFNGFRFMFKHIGTFILGLCLCCGIIFIQLIAYKVATGNFLIYAYTEERFYFLKPHIADILFSYKKGLFLYTPILLVSMFGYLNLWHNNKFRAISHFLFLGILTYVLSCWWSWWYGGGFSGRVFMEFMPFFILLYALLLQGTVNKTIKKSLLTLSVILTLICQIQIYQYRHYQIHWEDTTKEMYWNNFMRIDKLM